MPRTKNHEPRTENHEPVAAPLGAVCVEPPAPKPAPKSRPSLAPESLEPEQCHALQSWALEKGHPATPEALTHAWETVRGWSHAGGKKRDDWYKQTQNAIRKGWALEGYDGPGAKRDRSKMTFDEINLENRNELNRKTLAGELDESAAIDSGTFELALRQLPDRRR